MNGDSQCQVLIGETSTSWLESFIRNYYEGIAIDAVQIREQIVPTDAGAKRLRIWIFTAKPGAVIGRRGRAIRHLEQILEKKVNCTVKISVRGPKREGGNPT